MRHDSFFGDRSGLSGESFRLLGLWIVPVIFPEVALFVQQWLILEICGEYEARGEIYTFMLIRWHEYGCRGHSRIYRQP